MRDTNTINIGNTYRVANFHASVRRESLGRVTNLNQLKGTRLNDHILKETYWYKIYHDKQENSNLENEVFKKKFPVSYITDSVAPIYALLGLHKNKDGEIVYTCRSRFSDREIKNVYRASMLDRTVVNIPVVYGQTTPTDIRFNVWDIRYMIDRVDLDFLPLDKSQYQELSEDSKKAYLLYDGQYVMKPIYKYEYYQDLHEYLARLRMQLNLICEDLTDAAKVYNLYNSKTKKDLATAHNGRVHVHEGK